MMAGGVDHENENELAGATAKPLLAGIRIAIDARYLRQPGMGIHNYLSAGIKLIISEGADVTLLTNFDSGDLSKDFPGARWERFGSRHDTLWDQFDLPRHLRKRTFHFYWAPGNNGIPWRATGATKKVSTTHDIIPLRLPRMYLYRRPLFALSYFASTLSGILRSDILITVSEASARDIYRTFHKRATVISSQLVLREKVKRLEQLTHNLFDRDYLIYTGGLDPRKNVKNLLEAFAISLQDLPALRLVIIGHGTEALRPLIKELNIMNNVDLTGYISDEEKFSLLSGARALVYPSLYEGFGLPILEAFAADLPVLTCRNSSLVEVARDAAVYVEPDSPASIAEGIAAILRTDVAESKRTLGRQRLKMYDPLEARRKLIEVFATNLSMPHSSRKLFKLPRSK